MCIRDSPSPCAAAPSSECIDVRLIRPGDTAGCEILHRIRGGTRADRPDRLAGAPFRRQPPGGGTRGRQPRLAVIDAATVDGRRRLVLIRRDNVEHLLMIGGPTDVVVEPNIVRG